ncbi:MAG: esterase/lipase family protein [Candidatus Dormibacteraceae bacterium]
MRLRSKGMGKAILSLGLGLGLVALPIVAFATPTASTPALSVGEVSCGGAGGSVPLTVDASPSVPFAVLVSGPTREPLLGKVGANGSGSATATGLANGSYSAYAVAGTARSNPSSFTVSCAAAPPSMTPTPTAPQAPPAPPTVNGEAVVLVSGFTTTTPFTTPAETCQGTTPEASMTFLAQTLRADGEPLYTAPVNEGPGPVKEQAPYFSDCPRLPADLTIDSLGDVNADGSALARFVDYLHATYGVDDVRFVGHSDGGIWSRAAVAALKSSASQVHVLSVTTLDTPHTGAFVADVLAGRLNPCANVAKPYLEYCQGTLDVVIAIVTFVYAGRALPQLTASYMKGWNQSQAGVLGQIPVTVLSGDAFDLFSYFGVTNPYISPSDVVVGLSSQEANGLESQGVIPNLHCFAPLPDVHVPLLLYLFPEVLFPDVKAITDDPRAAAQVQQTLLGRYPTTACSTPAPPVPIQPTPSSAAGPGFPNTGVAPPDVGRQGLLVPYI